MWSLRPEDRRRRTVRGFGAAVLSVLLPGLGQLAMRHHRRAAGMLAVSLSVIGAGVWLAGEPATLLSLLLRPDALPWLLGGNLALLLFRLAAAVDAYVLGARPPALPYRPRGSLRSVATACGVAVLVGAVATPHILAGYATATTARVVAAVFVEDAQPVAAAVEPVAAPLLEPVVVPDLDATIPLEEQVPPERAPAPAVNPWADDDRLTVAILGSDAGPGRSGSRLDALLVGSLDTRSGAAVVVSVDRYLASFPLPDHLLEVYAQHCPLGDGWRYLNALYTCGVERIEEELAALYPDAVDPAARAVADTLGILLDIEVDHYALVDMGGFVGVVDALGGVQIELSRSQMVRMSPAIAGEPWRTFDLPAGPQVLDGQEAIAYVRVRGSGGDRLRMERQRCLVAGAIAAADPVSLLRGFPALASALEEHVTTDVPVSRVPALLELLLGLEVGPFAADGFGPPTYRGGDHVPDVPAIQARMADLLAGEVEDAQLVTGPSGGACP